MYRNRFTSSTTSTSPANGVYGSSRIGTFFKDLINGTDCLDIVLIGDSNTARGEYGYNAAFTRVLNDYLKVPNYATTLFPGGIINLSNGQPTDTIDLQSVRYVKPDFAAGFPTSVSRGSTNYSTGSYIGYIGTQGVFYGPGNHLSGSNQPKFLQMEADNGETYAKNFCENAMPSIDFKSTTNFPTGGVKPNWWVNASGNASPAGSNNTFSFNDWTYAPIFIRSGDTYTSPANNNYIQVYGNSRFKSKNGAANNDCQYRVVHALFGNGPIDSRFSLTVWGNGSSSPRTSHTGTNGYSSSQAGLDGTFKAYATKTFDYTGMGNTISDTVRFGFDGLNTGSSIKGPFCCLWHSIVDKNTKGYSVNTLCGRGGTSTGDLKEITNNFTNNVPAGALTNSPWYAFFEELKNRQTANGNGSGRVLVVIQSGINDNAGSSQYSDNILSIVNNISLIWSRIQGVTNNLTFLIIPTHPTLTDLAWTYPPFPGGSNTQGYRKVVIDQIPKILSSTEGKNVTIVDIEKMFNGIKSYLQGYSSTNTLSYYDSGGNAHLNSTNYTVSNGTTYPLPDSSNNNRASPNNGYDATVATIIQSLTNIV